VAVPGTGRSAETRCAAATGGCLIRRPRRYRPAAWRETPRSADAAVAARGMQRGGRTM
jgi:hypothetical protein